jgi:hypothetical protein
VRVQVKRGSIVGVLLVFFGIIGCFYSLPGGLVLIGFGIIVTAVGGRELGLLGFFGPPEVALADYLP